MIISVHFIKKAAYFKILQLSSKFQSTFATLGNDRNMNISDDHLTKVEEFVCQIYCRQKKKM